MRTGLLQVGHGPGKQVRQFGRGGFVAMLAPLRQVILIADGDDNVQLAITARALSQQVELPETQLFRPVSIVDEAASSKLVHT